MSAINITIQAGSEVESIVIDAVATEALMPEANNEARVEMVQGWIHQSLRNTIIRLLQGVLVEEYDNAHISEGS